MQKAKDYKALGSHGTIGLEVVLSILFGLFLGTKLDEWLGTAPWMAVIWFGFGCAAGGRSIYRAWKNMQAAAKREEAEEGNPAQQFPDEKVLAWKREEDQAREEQTAPAPPADESSLEKDADDATEEHATNERRAEKRDE